MKRYIAAVLIPCFLLQLCGCYTMDEITLDELKNENEAIITTQDSTKYYLTQSINDAVIIDKPNSYFSDNWVLKPEEEKIMLITQSGIRVKESSKIWHIKKDTVFIKYQDIKNVSVENFNVALLIIGIGITLLIIIGIGFESLDFGSFKIF